MMAFTTKDEAIVAIGFKVTVVQAQTQLNRQVEKSKGIGDLYFHVDLALGYVTYI